MHAAVALPFLLLGLVTLVAPGAVGDALGKVPASAPELTNLRANVSGTLIGIAAALATGRFSPASFAGSAGALLEGRFTPALVMTACGMLWITLSIAIVRGFGFVLDGSPDLRQWIYLIGELILAAGAALYLRGR